MAQTLAFNKPRLVETLETLPAECRIIFAVACAERQLPACFEFEKERSEFCAMIFEEALSFAWSNIGSRVRETEQAELYIEQCMALIPDEGTWQGAWTEGTTRAQNASMAVTYALRTLLSREAQEAVWAAETAYDSVDDFALRRLLVDVNLPSARAEVLRHPVVQAELQRQARDLDELSRLKEHPHALDEEYLQRFRARAREESASFYEDK